MMTCRQAVHGGQVATEAPGRLLALLPSRFSCQELGSWLEMLHTLCQGSSLLLLERRFLQGTGVRIAGSRGHCEVVFLTLLVTHAPRELGTVLCSLQVLRGSCAIAGGPGAFPGPLRTRVALQKPVRRAGGLRCAGSSAGTLGTSASP